VGFRGSRTSDNTGTVLQLARLGYPGRAPRTVGAGSLLPGPALPAVATGAPALCTGEPDAGRRLSDGHRFGREAVAVTVGSFRRRAPPQNTSERPRRPDRLRTPERGISTDRTSATGPELGISPSGSSGQAGRPELEIRSSGPADLLPPSLGIWRFPQARTHALKRTSSPDSRFPLHPLPPRSPKPPYPHRWEHPPNPGTVGPAACSEVVPNGRSQPGD